MSKLAAGGYYDLSRLASQNPQMNQDISLTNRTNLLNWLDEFIKELSQLRYFLAQDNQNLEKAFKEAEEARRQWLLERQNG
jgi:prephenate dehydrogenase